ncbi:uncharacterized protein L3040_001162 [Drepanopeziza brunnea f. sp. 'multigermtubi']|uniref:uncharacterized protein n=1 Tax=Drepanopeziza brunnea f. sp. 'multigermtubi' TaxID=698441 RepID=UPI00239EBE20|nr:hypothetical protein L3040_001162 [Drepanopeziza brunnea f. sp. 'multigermtubi']
MQPSLSSLEERKRRSRNIVFAAFLLLVVIWSVKLAFPHHTLASAYQNSNNIDSDDMTPLPPPVAAATEPEKSAQAGPTALDSTKPVTPFNDTQKEKVAVIIETRFRTNLVPLILHFSSVLGPSWPIIIYTSPEAVGMFVTSAALARYIKIGTIEIRILPQETLFTNSDSVNAFMTNSWLWTNLAPYEHILIFQSDSMLCANAARSVEDFFEYDLVGAPIAADRGSGYNGGLSLRKRSTILRVLDRFVWEEEKHKGAANENRFEDQYYYNRMKALQDEEAAEDIDPKSEGAINLPTMEVARTFSVETIDYPHPLGVHQVHRWLKKQMVSLDDWCPEYKLCSVSYIKDEPA